MSRSAGRKKPSKYYVIACEGTKTEPLYFSAFRLASKKIVSGGQYKKIIDNGISCYNKKKEELGRDTEIELWCVFDEDGNTGQFQDAINYINEKHRQGIKIFFAGSNESFELWYLLHFKYSTAQKRRSYYIDDLNSCITGGYDKCRGLYQAILDKQKKAIGNAEKLIAYNVDNGRGKFGKPSTHVQNLVKSLNREVLRKNR